MPDVQPPPDERAHIVKVLAAAICLWYEEEELPAGPCPACVAEAEGIAPAVGSLIGAHVRVVEVERDRLAQAMWDARCELGFDCDGDATPGAAIAGSGYVGFAERHVAMAREARLDHDAAIHDQRRSG